MIEVRGNSLPPPTTTPVSVGPEAIIQDGMDCAAAGAAGYHWHARGEDGIERPDDIGLHRAVARGLRDSGLILHPTLGFISTQETPPASDSTRPKRPPDHRVDMVPADIGAIILDGWDSKAARFASDDKVLLNTTAYLIALLTALSREDVRVLAVVWSPGAVRSALRLQECGILAAPTFWRSASPELQHPAGRRPRQAWARHSSNRSRPRSPGQSTYATDSAWRWRSGPSPMAVTSASGWATTRTPTWSPEQRRPRPGRG